jgi:DNA-binding YbaB/EbfC family protein
MAKRPYGKPKKSKAGMDPGNLMDQMRQMQQEMVEQQEALAEETISVTAAGGVITVEITGQQRVKSITIAPEAVDPEDVEMLQDMLVAAVNTAIEQSQAMAAQRMEGLTGGLDMNSLLGGLGM